MAVQTRGSEPILYSHLTFMVVSTNPAKDEDSIKPDKKARELQELVQQHASFGWLSSALPSTTEPYRTRTVREGIFTDAEWMKWSRVIFLCFHWLLLVDLDIRRLSLQAVGQRNRLSLEFAVNGLAILCHIAMISAEHQT